MKVTYWKYSLFEEEQDSCNVYLSDLSKRNPYESDYSVNRGRTDNPDYALKFNSPDEAAEYCKQQGEHFAHFRIEAIPEE